MIVNFIDGPVQGRLEDFPNIDIQIGINVPTVGLDFDAMHPMRMTYYEYCPIFISEEMNLALVTIK